MFVGRERELGALSHYILQASLSLLCFMAGAGSARQL